MLISETTLREIIFALDISIICINRE